MDIDGTLMNGNAPVAGVADSCFRLLTDETKKVLFYSNGGYCNNETTWKKVVSWMRSELTAENFAIAEPLLTVSLVYNTAQLTAKYLATKLEPEAKVLCFGNAGLNEELLGAGLRSEILKPLLPGETVYSPALSDTQFGVYETDPEVKAIAKGVCQLFDQRKLAIASLYLQNPDTLFVATNDDPVFIAGSNGRLYPDVGATLAALETACDRKAFRIGKPSNFALSIMLEDHFKSEEAQWT